MRSDDYREWSRQLWNLCNKRHEIMEQYFDKALYGK